MYTAGAVKGGEGRGGEGLSSHCIHGTHILGRISLPVSQ